MIKVEDSWGSSAPTESHYTCCGCYKKIYFDHSDLKGKKTIITCPNCGEKTEYTYLKLGERE